MREFLRLLWKLAKVTCGLCLIVGSLLITFSMVWHGWRGDYARAAFEGIVVLIINQRVDRLEEE